MAMLRDGLEALPELARLAQGGRSEAVRAIVQHCNQRLFRIARSIVRDDAEAEDIVQDAYIKGFRNFDSFRNQSSILTWFTRIVLNEAHDHLRRRHITSSLDEIGEGPQSIATAIAFPLVLEVETPEAGAARSQVRERLECAIDALPIGFRTVFVMRDVEDCSIEETAANLDLLPQTVKTRLHRARRLLRKALGEEFTADASGAFPFLGERCRRITGAVLAKLGHSNQSPRSSTFAAPASTSG